MTAQKIDNTNTISGNPQGIVGGSITTIDQIPFQISLELLYSHICGGAIINNEWIITAAHCVDGFVNNPDVLTVHAGSTDQTDNSIGQRITVDQVITHGDWDGNFEAGNDIALLHLSIPLCYNNNVQPIDIAYPEDESNFSPGDIATISGWGKFIANAPFVADNLRSVDIPIISNAEAGSLFAGCGGTFNVFNSLIAFFDPNKMSGGGDSGGPAFINIDGKAHLIGVTSFGCADQNSNPVLGFPSVYTRVSSFTDFINNNITEPDPCAICPGDQPFDLCSPCHDDPFVLVSVTGTQSFNQSPFHGIITVEPDAILNLSSDILFSPQSSIVVKPKATVNIDGATLSSFCSDQKWQGIVLQDDVSYVGIPPASIKPGQVNMINNAIIEKAKIGIDANPYNFLAPMSQIGGVVDLRNSTIRECNTAVNLGPVSSRSKSKIENCLLQGGEYGIKISGNQNNTEIFTNTFEDIFGDGIYLFNSMSHIDGNSFDYVGFGVNMGNTQPSIASSIISNNTFTNSSGIFFDAYYAAASLDIYNNLFLGSASVGIEGIGLGYFNITNNEFIDLEDGTNFWATGLDESMMVENNTFLTNDYGGSNWFDNSVEYLNNCFDGQYNTNIEVNPYTAIFPSQGYTDYSAGNCYNGSAPRVIADASCTTFDYFLKDGTIPQDCHYVNNVGQNFVIQEADDNEFLNCGTGLNIFGALPYHIRACQVPSTFSAKQDMIATIEQEIIRINNLTNISPALKRWLIARYKRCLAVLKKAAVHQIITDSDHSATGREDAISFLSSQPEFRLRAMAYGLILDYGDYARASGVLASLSANTQEELDFVFAQQLYLSYLSDMGAFSLSTSDRTMLNTIGLKPLPLSGFSRNIYYILTGEQINIDKQHMNVLQPRLLNQKAETIAGTIKLYPNPTTEGSIQLSLDSFDSQSNYQYTLRNIIGTTVNNGSISSHSSTIDLMDMSNGVYLIEVKQGNEIIFVEKFVKL